jgi:hypothetical protein
MASPSMMIVSVSGVCRMTLSPLLQIHGSGGPSAGM